MKKLTLLILALFFKINFVLGQNSVKKIIGPELNGIKQRLSIRGDDDSKPLLLFLHGGPGFGSMGYSKKFVKELKSDFVIVQWDQRNTGATKAWNNPAPPLNLELMHEDTEAVVNYLLEQYGQKKLYLVGFSWGAFLGFEYARQHPEKLYAYVSVSGLVNGNVSEFQILNDLKDKADENNDTEAINELASVSIPFENGEDLFLQRKWTGSYFPSSMQNTRLKQSMVEDWSVTWLPIFLEAADVDYGKLAPKIECPVYFFHSPEDRVSHYSVARAYFEVLDSPQKKWVDFLDAPHEIVSAQPKVFSQAMMKLLEQTMD